ncbi:MAG: methyltransferase domain-containing protein [Planctomycetes bacterium]|nr:methyltransferase domain-containing protein [Planctomycetota bacterium]
METHIYDQFAALEQRHFWFRGRRAIFFDLLARELGERREDLAILEVGCGPGGMLEPLARFGAVCGLDIAHDALRYCKHRGFPRVATGSGTELPFADASFDVVALFDAIEHIEDDRAALAEVRRILKPGGLVFISVPAYQFLYSQNDRLVHHQRRYTRGQLERLLRGERLTPRKLTYFNTFLFPLILPAVMVLKLKERLFGLPRGQTNLSHEFAKPINGLFAWAMSAERWLLRHMDFPFGHSLIAIARG